MARLKTLTILFLFLFQAATAWGQVDFGAVCTPAQRAEAVKAALVKPPANGVLIVPDGIYDFPAGYVFPPSVVVKCQSRGGAVFQSPAIWTSDRACCFGLSDGTVLENLTLESTCGDKQQSTVVGYAIDSDKPRASTLRKVTVKGKAWGVYTWSPPDGNSIVIDDCDISAAYVGINLGRSSGASAQFVTVRNSRINMNPLLSSQGGSTTNPTSGGVAGIVVRGGRLSVSNCTITATGPRPGYGPRLCAIADNLEGGTKHSVLEIIGLTSKLVPGAETIRVDIDNQLGKVLIGGTGSAPDGSLLVRKPTP